jgi:hypothetical protein
MNTMGMVLVSCLRAATEESVCPMRRSRLHRHELFRENLRFGGVVITPAKLNPKVAVLDPTQRLEFSTELVNHPSCVGGRADPEQHSDAPDLARLLRPRRVRPAKRRTAQEPYELPPLHAVPQQPKKCTQDIRWHCSWQGGSNDVLRRNAGRCPMAGLGSSVVLLTQLWPPQIRVRSTPNSGHHSDGSEHLRFVPIPGRKHVQRKGWSEPAATRSPRLRGQSEQAGQ